MKTHKNAKLRILIFALIMTLLMGSQGSLAFAAAGDSVGITVRLATVEGTVGVSDATGKTLSTKAGMKLYEGYRVSTEQKSYAYISLDDTKVIKMNALSQVEVKQSGKKFEVRLISGEIFYSVTEKLKGDESMTIKTSNMTTGVRGTTGIILTNPQAKTSTNVQLSGTTVSNYVPAGGGGEESTVTQTPGQTLTFVNDPGQTKAVVAELKAEDVKGFAGVELQKDHRLLEAVNAALPPEIKATVNIEQIADKAEAQQKSEEQQAATELTTHKAELQTQTPGGAIPSTQDLNPLFGILPTQGPGEGGTSALGGAQPVVQVFETTTPVTGEGGGSDTGQTTPTGPTEVPFTPSTAMTVGANQVMNISGTQILSAPLTLAGGTLNIPNGATLTVEGTNSIVVNSGSVVVAAGGTLAGTGSGTLGINGGSFTNQSGTTVKGLYIRVGNPDTHQEATFVNEASGKIDDCTIDVKSGATFTNKGDALISGSAIIVNSGGTFNNGTSNTERNAKIVGGTVTNEGTFNNYATIATGEGTMSSALITNKGNFTNTGSGVISGGSIALSNTLIKNEGAGANFESSGIIRGVSASEKAVIKNSGGTLNIAGGDVTDFGNYKAIYNESGTFTMADGTVEAKGIGDALYNAATATTINGGTISNTNNGKAINNTGTLNMNNGTVKAKTSIAFENGGTGTINGGEIISTEVNGKAIWNTGTLNMTAGTVSAKAFGIYCNGSGSVTLSGGTVTADDGNAVGATESIAIAIAADNTGLVTITSGAIVKSAGIAIGYLGSTTPNVTLGGIAGGTSVSQKGWGEPGKPWTKTIGTTALYKTWPASDEGGMVEWETTPVNDYYSLIPSTASAGTVDFNGDTSQTITSGQTMTITGSQTLNPGNTLTVENGGTLVVNSGTLTVEGTLNNAGTIAMGSATIINKHSFTNTGTVSGGSIALSDPLIRNEGDNAIFESSGIISGVSTIENPVIKNTNGGSLNITGGEVTDFGAYAAIENESGTLTMTGGTVSAITFGIYCADSGSGSVNLYDGIVNADDGKPVGSTSSVAIAIANVDLELTLTGSAIVQSAGIAIGVKDGNNWNSKSQLTYCLDTLNAVRIRQKGHVNESPGSFTITDNSAVKWNTRPEQFSDISNDDAYNLMWSSIGGSGYYNIEASGKPVVTVP